MLVVFGLTVAELVCDSLACSDEPRELAVWFD